MSLSVVAAISRGLLAVGARKNANPKLDSVHLKGFKGETVAIRLSKATITSFLTMRVVSLNMPDDRNSRFESMADGSFSYSFVPTLAGRRVGLEVTFEIIDPVGLFNLQRREVYPDFILDVLPEALLSPLSKPKPSILAMGEVAGGSPGQGQEIYGIENYQPYTDTKNILWKRAARSPDQSLLVGTRESNIPRLVKVEFVQQVDRGAERDAWIDLFCEGASILGMNFLGMGSDLLFGYSAPDGQVITRNVSDVEDLSDIVMQLSAVPLQHGSIDFRPDVLITGQREIGDPYIDRLASTVPTLLISDSGVSVSIAGRYSVVFTGGENLLPLIQRTTER